MCIYVCVCTYHICAHLYIVRMQGWAPPPPAAPAAPAAPAPAVERRLDAGAVGALRQVVLFKHGVWICI